MNIHQIKLSKMATFCYLIGDEASHTCALIDPAFDTEKILNKADNLNYSVTHVINTHRHADHCSGNAAIINATGAKLLAHEKDARHIGNLINGTLSRIVGGKPSPKPDVRLNHDDIIQIGQTRLKVLHTPGHTPGGICLYGEGHVFTGDTLFVGAVGRTDLPGGSARELLNSIKKSLYSLPGQTRVWPGHDYGETTSSTISHEQQANPFTI